MGREDAVKYPVRMLPAFKDYIWGGNKLVSDWGKSSPFERTAESWELSAHVNGQSTAANGVYKGMTLSQIIERLGTDCLGTSCEDSDRFPILIKFIDPCQKLSIQVHPDDDYALKNEGDHGKTEMWYIAQADPGSRILCGFKRDLSIAGFIDAVRNDTLPGLLNDIPVKKKDVFLIEPGTVHAICENQIIAEIQQNSDVTYRVYDYDRRGPDGNPRELHVSKAVEVSNLTATFFDGKSQGELFQKEFGTIRMLVSCRYFTVTEYDLTEVISSAELTAGSRSFHALTFIDGSGTIRYGSGDERFSKGDTFFIPSGTGTYTVEGRALFLQTEVLKCV